MSPQAWPGLTSEEALNSSWLDSWVFLATDQPHRHHESWVQIRHSRPGSAGVLPALAEAGVGGCTDRQAGTGGSVLPAPIQARTIGFWSFPPCSPLQPSCHPGWRVQTRVWGICGKSGALFRLYVVEHVLLVSEFSHDTCSQAASGVQALKEPERRNVGSLQR